MTYKWIVLASVSLLLGAIVLYFATVYTYDRLLMPPQRWRSRDGRGFRIRKVFSNIERDYPGIDDLANQSNFLYQNMIYAWSHLFNPATFLLGVGLMLFAYALTKPDLAQSAILLAVPLAAFVYARLLYPHINVSD